jgi:TolB-like protein
MSNDDINLRAGLAVIQERAGRTKALGAAVEQALNGGKENASKTFFVLLTFPVLSGPSSADYITNAMPEDVITVLRKTLDKLEGKGE